MQKTKGIINTFIRSATHLTHFLQEFCACFGSLRPSRGAVSGSKPSSLDNIVSAFEYLPSMRFRLVLYFYEPVCLMAIHSSTTSVRSELRTSNSDGELPTQLSIIVSMVAFI